MLLVKPNCDTHVLTNDRVAPGQVIEGSADVGLERLAVTAAETSWGRDRSSACHLAQRERVAAEGACREESAPLVLTLLLLTQWDLIHGCDHLQRRYNKSIKHELLRLSYST